MRKDKSCTQHLNCSIGLKWWRSASDAVGVISGRNHGGGFIFFLSHHCVYSPDDWHKSLDFSFVALENLCYQVVWKVPQVIEKDAQFAQTYGYIWFFLLYVHNNLSTRYIVTKHSLTRLTFNQTWLPVSQLHCNYVDRHVPLHPEDNVATCCWGQAVDTHTHTHNTKYNTIIL